MKCYGIAFNSLDKAGNFLGTGIGIVFALLGRRILDGKPGVLGRGTSPGSVFHRARKEESCNVLSQRNEHKRVKTGACSVGKPTEKYRCHTQSNLTLGVIASYYLLCISTQRTRVNDNESVLHRQTYGEIPVSHPA